MIVSLGALTQAQADRELRDCLALGLRRSACELQAGMVDGRVCDGTIVVEVGSRRCVSAAQQATKASAAEASPLPPRSSSSLGLLLAGGAGVLLVAGLVVAFR